MSISSPQKNGNRKKLIIFDKDGYVTNEVSQICKDIGINEQDLYERDFSEFSDEQQQSSTQSQQIPQQQKLKIQQMRYDHYERRRQVKINAVKETMKLIRGAEEEKLKIEKTLQQQSNQMSIVDLKQNKNKELKLQQIIKEMEKEQFLNNNSDQADYKKQTIQTDYPISDSTVANGFGGDITYNPNHIKTNHRKEINNNNNNYYHIKQGYGIESSTQQQNNKQRGSQKHRSYSHVKNGENDEDDSILKQKQYSTNKSMNQKSANNMQTILSDAQNISLASKSVVIPGRRNYLTSVGNEEHDYDDTYHSRNATIDKVNSKSSNKLFKNAQSLSPYSKINKIGGGGQQNNHNNSVYSQQQQSMSYVVDNLNYDVKLKLVRKLMRMERNDLVKKELTQKEQEKENEIKQELEQKEQLFAQNHAKIQKEKEEQLKKRMKNQNDHQKIVRMQVKQRQKDLEKERINIQKQHMEEIKLRLQIEQQLLEDEEKQSFLRFLERNEEKRQQEQRKKAKYEEQVQKAKEFMTEIEREQQAKQQKHEYILAEKQKEISKKIETRQNRAKSNMIIREQEQESNKSHTIQKIIQSSQNKQQNSQFNNERRRNISVFNSAKINDIRSKKEMFERENSIKLLDKIKQYDIKSKQAEQFKTETHHLQAAQKKESFMLKREGVIENLAIQDYQWNVQRQKEMDKYKQKIEIAKINKNIKEEINFLTNQGVKDMYNIIKKQKNI